MRVIEAIVHFFSMTYISELPVKITLSVLVNNLVLYFFVYYLRYKENYQQKVTKEQKKTYKSVCQSIEETLIIFDAEMRITFSNKDFLGKKAKEYIGLQVNTLPFFRSSLLDLKEGQTEKFEWTYEGQEYSSKALSIYEDKEKIHTLLFSLNITEKKRYQENQIQKIKAETSLQSKIEFLANISHEIRNPLQGMIYSIENLISMGLEKEEKYCDIIKDIKDLNQLITLIIDDILEISKIKMGNMSMTKKSLNLIDVCDLFLGINTSQARKKGLELLLYIDPYLPRSFDSDKLRICQIMNNFLSNAIKFTKTGEITIEAKKVKENNQNYVQFTCNDTGCGIKKEDISKLFSVVDKQNTSSFQGFGLGLTISKGLIELLGGNYGVESDHGKGSSFWFKIPLLSPSEESILPEFGFSLINTLVVITKHEKLNQYIEKVANLLQIQDVKTFTKLPNINFQYSTVIIEEDLYESDKFETYESLCIIGKRREGNNLTFIENPLKPDQLISFLCPSINNDSPEVSRRNSSYSIMKNLNILVVEDSASINKAIVKLLQNMEITNIKSAFDGKEAINMIQQETFDIILMDIQMPM